MVFLSAWRTGSNRLIPHVSPLTVTASKTRSWLSVCVGGGGGGGGGGRRFALQEELKAKKFNVKSQ